MEKMNKNNSIFCFTAIFLLGVMLSIVPFSSAQWTEGLNDGLISYWNCSSPIEILHQPNSEFNLTISGGTPTFSGFGKINASCFFDGSSYFEVAEQNQLLFNTTDGMGKNVTINFWVLSNNTGVSSRLLSKRYVIGWGIFRASDDLVYTQGFSSVGITSETSINQDVWYMVTSTTNASHSCLFINGVLETCGARGTMQVTDFNLHIGSDTDGSDTFYGYIDEIGMWNRSLSVDEVNQLWHNDTGITYTDDFDTSPPYFTGIPNNSSVAYGTSISAKFNASDDIEVSNFAVNDTRFSITSSGLLTNATSLGVNYYGLNVSVTDGQNYNSTIWFIQVSQITPDFTFLINGQTNNLTLNYTTDLTINASAFDGVLMDLYRNGIAVPLENSKNSKLSAGTYIYSANFSGNQNYTATSTEFKQVIINQFVPNLIFLLNDGISNLTLTFPALINASAFDGIPMNLYRDGVAVPLENGHFVSVVYNGTNETIIYSVNYTGNENFTSIATQFKQVDVNTEAPTPTPTPTITGGTIYDVLSGSGAGLGLFILYLATALPILLIGLAIVVMIVIIGQGFVNLIRNLR